MPRFNGKIGSVLVACTLIVGAVSPVSASAATPAPPLPLSKCHKSSYSVQRDTYWEGRTWCVKSSDNKCETYFDTYNNWANYCIVSSRWYQIWIVNISGRGGYLHFMKNGEVQIVDSKLRRLWGNGAVSYSARALFITESGASSQLTYERVDSTGGAVVWKF